MTTNREKNLLYNTLSCLLKGLYGMETTIDLRHEDSVRGTVVESDGSMNTTLENVTYTDLNGAVRHMELMFIQGKNIRFVHIPDEVNVTKTIDHQMAMISGKRDVRVRKKPLAVRKREKGEATKQRLKEREAELMALIQSLGQQK